MMKNVKEAINNFWNDEEGIGIIEVLLILAVIIGIALIFRDQLIGLVTKIFGKNNQQIDEFFE